MKQIKRRNKIDIGFKLKSALFIAVLLTSPIKVLSATGDPLPDLTPNELAYFQEGKIRFNELEVQRFKRRHLKHADFTQLGPRYNLDSCGGCHSQPTTGGSSPAINPQIAAATRLGAINTIPSFINLNSPVREARFKQTPTGLRDGGVHNLFVITGRSDAGSCNIQQPNFDIEIARNNVSFRIPTPAFGLGLIEAIPEQAILDNKRANQSTKRMLGIAGHENRNGNDGTITRFGWKAQNKSLLIFSGEAYNVEEGVTNELFPNKRDETQGCTFSGLPEDHTFIDEQSGIAAMSDVVAFTHFMKFLAPPAPKPATVTSKKGSDIFTSVGCAMCHTPSLQTGQSSSAALSNKTVNLYSDLLVHHMGSVLEDGVTQGLAVDDEFRTAPLWGVSDRLYYLHDGRATDLMMAIQAHHSNGGKRSEADMVIDKFNLLSDADKQSVIEFLKTL